MRVTWTFMVCVLPGHSWCACYLDIHGMRQLTVLAASCCSQKAQQVEAQQRHNALAHMGSCLPGLGTCHASRTVICLIAWFPVAVTWSC